MATNLPRRTRLVRTENMVPNHDDASLPSKVSVKDANKSFARTKSDTKPALGGKTSSTLLAPTASSKAKSVGGENGKPEKRKRDALTDKNVLKPKTLALNSQTNRKTSAAKPVVVKKQPIFTRPKDASDDNRMQVCEDQNAPVGIATLPPVDEHEHDDLDEPAPKRQHTLSPPPSRASVSEETDADQVARDLRVVAEDEEDERPHTTQDWEDLDAQDWDDPQMVAEYVVEVSEYLKELEPEVAPSSNYIDTQPALTWTHRRETLLWIYSIHARFGLQNETWFLTVYIFDRFLSRRQLTVSKLQIMGLACLFIAAKFEETYVPSVKHMVPGLAPPEKMEDEKALEAFVEEMSPTFMAAERYILQTIGWDLRYPSPMTWLRRGSKADNLDDRVRLVGKYLMDVASMDWRFVGVSPSLLAASSLYLARLMLDKPDWTANLRHYTTFQEEELIPSAQLLIECLLRPRDYYWSTFQKYWAKRYSRVSLFCRTWAKERFEVGVKVDLQKDLEELKRDIESRLAKEIQKRERQRRKLMMGEVVGDVEQARAAEDEVF